MSVTSNIIFWKTKIGFCCFKELNFTFSDLIRRSVAQIKSPPNDTHKNDFEIKNKGRLYRDKGLVFLMNNIPYFTCYVNEDIQSGLCQFNENLISKFAKL